MLAGLMIPLGEPEAGLVVQTDGGGALGARLTLKGSNQAAALKRELRWL
jgi:hypothetical protein